MLPQHLHLHQEQQIHLQHQQQLQQQQQQQQHQHQQHQQGVQLADPQLQHQPQLQQMAMQGGVIAGMSSQSSVVEDLMGVPQQHQHHQQQQLQHTAMVQQQQQQQQQPSCSTKVEPKPLVVGQTCIRQGCNNQAIENPDWEDEYCSQECVVAHCRAVFAIFQEDCLKGNGPSQQQQPQTFPTVK
uniref:Uncharacterized protein n=1 Tax=Anopheles epiroticus TaxID=199890 RepID=A0A182PSU4_9DIPT